MAPLFPVRRVFFSGALALLLAIAPLAATEWKRFRGPNGSGVSSATQVPNEFGPETNVAWKATVPFGRSSPVVSAERIFLTAVDNDKLVTMALDRASGKTLWRREIVKSVIADLYEATDSATPSPVTDGENVYAFFQESGLVSYDKDGALRWHKRLGPFRNYYGIASSPLLSGSTLLLLCDQAEGSFLLALDKDSGAEIWRRNRPARLESYTTPILYPDAKSPKTVLVSGSRWIDAYDLSSGESVWALPGVGTGPISSPVLDANVLYVNATQHAKRGWPIFEDLLKEHDSDGDSKLGRKEVEGAWLFDHFGWLDADGSGLLTGDDWDHMREELVNDAFGVYAVRIPGAEGKAEILWNYRQNVPYIPSPLLYEGVFYIVKDGIVTSLDPKTGELYKRGRIAAGSPKVHASPVAAAGKILVPTLKGQLAVLAAGGEWEVLGLYDLGEEIYASPAIDEGQVYLRTKTALYRFEVPAPGPTAAEPKAETREAD